MELGVLTVPFGNQPREEAFEYLNEIGVDCVELGVGGYPGEDHVDRAAALDNEDAQANLLDLLAAYDLLISALATHNNPLQLGRRDV